jgi:hypothetical protein
MAKGQQRSNREKKKPKADKKPPPPATSPFTAGKGNPKAPGKK